MSVDNDIASLITFAKTIVLHTTLEMGTPSCVFLQTHEALCVTLPMGNGITENCVT